MLLVLLFLVCANADNIGTVGFWYVNETLEKSSCSDIPDCYTKMCRKQNHNDGDVVGIYYFPDRACRCWPHVKNDSPPGNYSDLLLFCNNKEGSMIDYIYCQEYADCVQKMCLLANEPGVKQILLGSAYGDVLDCR